jgi:hypothetical protein
MTSPSGLYEWLALAAAVVAAIMLLLLVWIAFSLRRVRQNQKIVLGGSERDIVAHAASLQNEFVALRDWLDEASGQLDARMNVVEERLDGAVAHTAMLRYDAFGAMSGRQSSSVALLDEKKNGVVLSAIVHRSNSHLYVKKLHEGVSEIELSPEEKQVVAMAFAEPGPPEAAPVAPQPPRVVTTQVIAGEAPKQSQPRAQEHPSNPPAAGAAGR